MVFPQKPAKLKAAMADILENAEANLTPQMRNLVDMLWGEWRTVEQQIEELTDKLEQISASDAGCSRIRKIPGIGPIVATAIVAAIGNGAAFRKGRDFAAWLGLVPRQYSTGGKAKLLGISKRGNIYLRKVEKKDGRYVNAVIKTYPDVSQFWTYKQDEFLKNPVYSRDYPPAKNLEQ